MPIQAKKPLKKHTVFDTINTMIDKRRVHSKVHRPGDVESKESAIQNTLCDLPLF